MKKLLAGLLGAVLSFSAHAADTASDIVVPIQGDTANMCTIYVSGHHVACHVTLNGSGAEVGLVTAPFFVKLVSGGAAVDTLPVSIATVPTHAVTVASGGIASGAVASGAFASGSIASGALAAGSMVDLLTMRGPVGAGTAAANSILGGAVYNSTLPTIANTQQAALQVGTRGALMVQLMAPDSTSQVGINTSALTGVTASAVSSRVLSPMYMSNGTTLDVAVSGAGTVGAGVIRTTQASDSPVAAATGSIGDAAYAGSGNSTLVAGLKGIYSKIDSTAVGVGTDAAPAGASAAIVGMHQRPHAKMLTNAVVSFSTAADHTIVTRATGTIKIYRMKLECASDVTLTFKSGTTARTGAMPTKQLYWAYEGGEPHIQTSGTDNFVITAGSAVACGGNVEYIDS